MQKIAAIMISILFSGCLFAGDYVPSYVAQEVEDLLSKDQVSSGKLLFRVDKLYLTDETEKSPVPIPSEIDKKSGFIMFKKNYTVPVYYNTKPAKNEIDPASFDYFCSPGHYGNVTIGLVPLETGDARVSIADLKSSSGDVFKSSNIEIRHVRHMVKKVGEGMAKVMPEVIMKGSTVKLYKDVTRTVWLIINTPLGTKPGMYEGAVSISMTGKSKREAKLKIEVLPITLLTDPERSFGWFVSPTDEIGLRDYLRHEFNSVASGFDVHIKSVSGGKAVLDFTTMDATMAMLKKVKMPNVRHIASVINFFGELEKLKIADFSSEYNSAYKDALAQMNARAIQNNIKLVYWLVDEPRDTMLNAWNRNIADTLKFAKLAKEVKGIESYQDVMQDTQFKPEVLAQFIDAFDVMSPHCVEQYCPKIISDTKKAKKQLWFYNTSVGRFGFSTWKHNAVGRTEWAYNCGMNERSVKTMDAWASNRPGDPACAVIFPSEKEVIPCPTWEIASQGIVDYRYVYTLEQAIAKANKGSAEAKALAKQAQAKLDKIKELAPEYADSKFDFNAGTEDAWRRTVADEIVKLDKVK